MNLTVLEKRIAETREIDTRKALEGIRVDKSKNNQRRDNPRRKRRTL